MIKQHPKVSVGILTYNSTQYLPQCLQSLLEQDYNNIEIVILDDASSDDSYVKCLEFAKKFDNIKVLKNEKNLGVLNSLAVLKENISGEYFMWATPDDDWSRNFISACVQKIDESGTVAAMGIVKNIWDTSEETVQEYIYDDLEKKISINKLLNSIVTAKDSHQKRISYNQFIHGLIKVDVLKTAFPDDHDIWVHEELLVCLLACLGGLCFAKECHHVNFHSSIPLTIRNPGFAKVKFSKICYFKGLWKYIILVLSSELPWNSKIQLCKLVGYVIYNRIVFKAAQMKIYLYQLLTRNKSGVTNESQV